MANNAEIHGPMVSRSQYLETVFPLRMFSVVYQRKYDNKKDGFLLINDYQRLLELYDASKQVLVTAGISFG
jgi:hypothetical protein